MKLLEKIKNLFTRRYVSIEDLIASYDPSVHQVGVKRGALDSINYNRFLKGERFQFNGSPADFVILPKPRKDNE